MEFKIQLCDYDTCTQCKACQSVCPKNCISFVPAADGFKIPRIDRDLCIECGACMRACHKITRTVELRKPAHAYAAWTTNLAEREKSSSGGAFSAIAHKALSAGGVVFGARMDTDLKVRHIFIEHSEDIHKLQGSKYIQSDLTGIYPLVLKFLKSGRQVLFTGVPCQVAGLLTYLRKPYDNLATCDLVCHGVPSQEAFDLYINKIGLKGKINNYSFRFTKGWGFQPACRLISPTGRGFQRRIILPPKAYYMRAFTKGLMFSNACYSCPYAQPERVSDITLADYWGLGAEAPFNYPTVKGISCVLANTEKGAALIDNCDALECHERPLSEAVNGNANLAHASEKPAGHDTYFEDSKRMTIRELSRKYGISASVRDYLRIVKQWINARR